MINKRRRSCKHGLPTRGYSHQTVYRIPSLGPGPVTSARRQTVNTVKKTWAKMAQRPTKAQRRFWAKMAKEHNHRGQDMWWCLPNMMWWHCVMCIDGDKSHGKISVFMWWHCVMCMDGDKSQGKISAFMNAIRRISTCREMFHFSRHNTAPVCPRAIPITQQRVIDLTLYLKWNIYIINWLLIND